ncbi:MAG: aspartyl-phosphate phosphatase Spo0E family protein [Bacillota bacterium]|nr:aspartyl-phosphate phosphatase Spo0E family protein [Bacillota bacterium]
MKEDLTERIATVRAELQELVRRLGCLDSPEVIEKARELDELIAELYRRRREDATAS